jgi:hypothetical protein
MDRVRFRAHECNTHVDEHGYGEQASNEYVLHDERKSLERHFKQRGNVAWGEEGSVAQSKW